MDCHLVAVEVCIECGTNKRMQLDCLTLYKDRLKCLNTKSVQCRCTVQHYRMLLDNLLKHIPYLRIHLVDKLFRIFNILADSLCHKLLHYKGLKQLDRHFLRQTALVNFQLGTYHNNGTSGIVNTLSEQVLTETSGFTLKHIGQGL